jgi:hypothetical protein
MLSRFFGKRDQPDATSNQDVRPIPAPPKSDPVAPPAAAINAPVRHLQPSSEAADTFPATLPSELVPMLEDGPQRQREEALAIVESRHPRISNTIRTLWGYQECSVYINRLIMAGGDGMGHARVGFNQDAVQAMLALSDLHDAEFGPPDTLSGALEPLI